MQQSTTITLYLLSAWLWAIGVRAAAPRQLNTKGHAPANYCDACGLTFSRPLEWEQHLQGRRHAQMLERYTTPENLLKEFEATAPHWAGSSLADPDVREAATRNISKHWNFDELTSLGLKMRATCLHPSTMMSKLSHWQKARIWRYLRDAMGVGYYTEVAAVMAAVDADRGGSSSDDEEESDGEQEEAPLKELRFINGKNRLVNASPKTGSHRDQFSKMDRGGFIRVKELFESFESYKQVANFIVAAEKTQKIDRIVELACGHGLVGVLLAYRFPEKKVLLVDRQRRGILDVFLRSFEAKGHESPSLGNYPAFQSRVLPNIEFVEGDVEVANSPDKIPPNSLVVAIHGCNEVNKLAIEMALSRQSAWVVMPCCIRKELYLEVCSVLLESDDARHAVMVGALASTYGAQYMGEIDSRITNRGIVVGGGVGVGGAGSAGQEADASTSSTPGVPKKFRGSLPKLTLS